MTSEIREWYADVPRSIRKHALFGIILMASSFGGFGVWALRAPLAAAVIAQGSFVATGQNKIVQHLEGGIIDAILVREGDTVSAGQSLVRLDRTAAEANERELFLRQARLEAMEARLLAENEGVSRIDFPEDLTSIEDDHEVSAILDGQEIAFDVSARSLENAISILDRNIEALDIRAAGYATQLASHDTQIDLLSNHLESKKHLFEKGLLRSSELVELERAVIEAQGQRGRLQAEIDEIRETQNRYRAEIEQAQAERREDALDELQGVQADLDSVREKARKAESVLRRVEVTAPVDGIVVRQFYHTAGGVVESGKPIVEILPSDAPLIIEVALSETDIDAVEIGQEAAVRLTALNQRTTPVLTGEVAYVSADTVTDRAMNGQPREIYIVRVRRFGGADEPSERVQAHARDARPGHDPDRGAHVRAIFGQADPGEHVPRLPGAIGDSLTGGPVAVFSETGCSRLPKAGYSIGRNSYARPRPRLVLAPWTFKFCKRETPALRDAA